MAPTRESPSSTTSKTNGPRISSALKFRLSAIKNTKGKAVYHGDVEHVVLKLDPIRITVSKQNHCRPSCANMTRYSIREYLRACTVTVIIDRQK